MWWVAWVAECTAKGSAAEQVPEQCPATPGRPSAAPTHPPLCTPQAKDLSQQVARLLHELQALQSGLPREAAGAASPGAAGFGGGTAADVTTQRLVEFKDIEVGAGGGWAWMDRRGEH